VTARSNGQEGERIVEGLLRYEGWEIIERQVLVYGHLLDFRAKHPRRGEALIEVKVWGAGGGKDTVKKAIGDAYDLREAGETTPYVLVLSHELLGLHGAMLGRAIRAGVIHEVRILGFRPFPGEQTAR
jgi:hypothetical protein